MAKINWSAPDADQKAVQIFNEAIVEYVRAYQKGGTAAMGNVLDKKQEKSRAQEFRTLMTNSPYLVEYVKEFNDYLETNPAGKLPGRWTSSTGRRTPSVEARGFRLSRHGLPRPPRPSDREQALAATHYFNASLEILAAVPTADGKSLYLLSLFRTRSIHPPGMLSGVLMGKVRDGVETGVKENLKTAQARLMAP